MPYLTQYLLTTHKRQSLWRHSIFLSFSAASIALCALALSTPSLAQPTSKDDPIQAGRYTLEKTHAYLMFSYSHLGFSQPRLLFRKMDAKLDLQPKNLARSKFSAVIDAASIDSGVAIFDKHLRNKKDFFEVAKHPQITYSSKRITKIGRNRYRVDGNLTIKGISKPARLEVTLNRSAMQPYIKKPALGFSAQGKIKRSDWGMDYAVPQVSDEVQITIEAEFYKEDEAPKIKHQRGKQY